MKKVKLNRDQRVESKFGLYPKGVRSKLERLRDLILETASGIEGLNEIEETLKWGEPSYLAKKGSTIRMDWKPGTPDQYALYFKCTSRLVPTFKTVFGATFKYEKNRAILFSLQDEIPEQELKACIRMALTYHRVKHEPFLGFDPRHDLPHSRAHGQEG